MKKITISIIGTGNIGFKRARSLPDQCELISCYDVDENQRKKFSNEFNCHAANNLEEILSNNDISAVVVSTLHDSLAKITNQALLSGKHVLVEKPAGLDSLEIKKIINTQKEVNKVVLVGFNHRYHPSIIKAREIISSGKLGDLMFIRGRYGHGGRIGYDKEWRSLPEKGKKKSALFFMLVAQNGKTCSQWKYMGKLES